MLHSKEELPVQGDLCRILASKRVTRCGDTYHYSHVTLQTEMLTPVYLTREACATAVATGVFHYEGQKIEVTPGAPSAFAYISKGKKPSQVRKGYCYPHPQPFYSGGKKYSDHIEETELLVTIEKTQGTRSINTDVVVFEDFKAPFLQGFMHTEDSAIFWDKETAVTCNNGIMQSFDGSAQVSTLRRNNGSYDDSIVMVLADQKKDILAGFKLAHHVRICNRTTYATNVPGTFLYIVPYNADVLPIRKFGLETKYTPVQKIQILTGNTAIFFEHTKNMFDGFKGVSQNLCRIEKATIQNKLDKLASGGKYALKQEYGPGYQLTIAASTAYVTKCEEKDATLATFHECTREIPVHIGANDTNSQILFADPLTYNLVPAPTIVTCDSVMPQKWVINGAWYCNWGDGNTPCPAPKTLDPRTTVRGIPSFNVPTGGIFTKRQMENHRLAVIIGDARVALENEFTATAVGGRVIHPDGTVTFGVVLPKDQIATLNDNFLWKYFSWAWAMGTSCSQVMYLLAAFRILVFLFDTARLLWIGWQNHGKLGKWVWGVVWYSSMELIFEEGKESPESKKVEEGIVLPAHHENKQFDPQASSSFVMEQDNE